MTKFFKHVGYGSLVVAAVVASASCSTTKENKPITATATNPTPGSQVRPGGQKSQALSDRNLPAVRINRAWTRCVAARRQTRRVKVC
jgi:hypothetical protein